MVCLTPWCVIWPASWFASLLGVLSGQHHGLPQSVVCYLASIMISLTPRHIVEPVQ
ncbi:hypothetical protein D0436_23520 [Shewanella decolorationis]|uniref:Uncharacterized protein n=1 Tax=Shewanella decolorationis TaxID=256839 RepID=A0A8A9LE32_9GAMM|nr:hypothetical protein [Shewanella decolorationis]QTS34877.1 hypothetical protein D0436_23520 [Shewanella decolorationis]